jgi:hypothetical protein
MTTDPAAATTVKPGQKLKTRLAKGEITSRTEPAWPQLNLD